MHKHIQERGERGGGGVEQREQLKGPLATQPGRENEVSQTNRGVRDVSGSCAPCPIKALADPPGAS